MAYRHSPRSPTPRILRGLAACRFALTTERQMGPPFFDLQPRLLGHRSWKPIAALPFSANRQLWRFANNFGSRRTVRQESVGHFQMNRLQERHGGPWFANMRLEWVHDWGQIRRNPAALTWCLATIPWV
jgi:hypothetical protein